MDLAAVLGEPGVKRRSERCRGARRCSKTPARVSWSVMVTKSMPRRLAAPYTAAGSVKHVAAEGAEDRDRRAVGEA